MGVTIGNNKKSIDLSYGGFNRLRTKVAYLANEDLGKFYDELNKSLSLFGKEREVFLEKYDERLAKADEEFQVSEELLDFLYASDCEGKITPKQCRHIYKVIKDYNDNLIYGYAGREDGATFEDFKTIVYDCTKRNVQLRWF